MNGLKSDSRNFLLPPNLFYQILSMVQCTGSFIICNICHLIICCNWVLFFCIFSSKPGYNCLTILALKNCFIRT
ncbi:hypothetical protein C8N47_104100 [Mangrovibacterium marinum]|uniref:Uncharacterized protein n=1 Tax=Mangrovibacterium marinum TaxID=1639118 RepID=A0A2T5C415_9BACT|nr:hypothetical protein C8N47_104100 [Mangrovibacterium marinum]